MMLPDEMRRFIARAPLLFIASRTPDGGCNLSPRGDEPGVLHPQPDGSFLMPDRAGNNRIETIRSLLERPSLSLALVAVGEDAFLQLEGQAEVLVDEVLRRPFAVRGELPVSVMRITLLAARFRPSAAFRDAGFWSPLARAQAPLRLRAVIDAQIAHHGGACVDPGMDRPAVRQALDRAGLAGAYPPLEPYVKGKAFAAFDPVSREFLQASRFIMLAHEGGMALLGGEEGFAEALDDRHLRIRSRFEPLDPEPAAGARVGALLGKPGRNEAMRLNGAIVSSEREGDQRVTLVRTAEIYLHCSNALARSRVWRPKSSLAWSGTRRFVCRERVEECKGVVSFLLAPEDDAPLPAYGPGQYVTVSVPEDTSCPPQARCYSLSDAPGGERMRITVRRERDGRMSEWLHDRVQPGFRLLQVGAPRGRFLLDDGSSRVPVLVSAGVGLTPVAAMLAQLTRTAPGRAVWFIHGARCGEEHALRGWLRAQAAANPGLRTHVAYSQPGASDQPGRDFDAAGRLDATLIARLVDTAGADFYLCGPPGFMQSLSQGLQQLGVPRERIRQEFFGAGEGGAVARARAATRAGGPVPRVTFTRSERQVSWDESAGSLLGLALKLGLDAPYICRSGDCQSCALRLEGGEVTYPDDLDVMPPEGYLLMCQAVPAGDVSIEL